MLLELALLLAYATNIRCQSSGSCVTGNYACLVQNNQIGSYNETNMLGCQERCQLRGECNYWTHWSQSDLCQLFSMCQDSGDNCRDCQTGNRSCGREEKYVSLISGGINKQTEIPARDDVYVVGSTGVCKQPDFLKTMSQMPRHRWGHVSTFLGSSFIVCGGSTEQDGNIAPNDTCDMFNLNTHEWEEMDVMSTCRHQAAGVSLLGKFYVTGGVNIDGSIADTTEVYDPSTGQWSPGPRMPLPLTDHCVVKHADTLVIIGGRTDQEYGNESSLVLSLNITTGSWSPLGSLNISRSGHGCSINEREEIIVTGGRSLGHCTRSTEQLEFRTPAEVVSTQFVNLPVKISHHVQSDHRTTQLYGGDVSSVDRNFVIQYLDQESSWVMTNVTLPQSLSYHHLTRYPASLVICP